MTNPILTIAKINVSTRKGYVVGDLKKDDGGMFPAAFSDWLASLWRW